MRENRTSHLVGRKTYPTIIIAPVGDRTHDLPHTVLVYSFKHGQGVPRPYPLGIRFVTSVSVSVSVLVNNALRAHHASAHDGVSTNGLSDIFLIFFEMILLSCLK